VTPATWFGVARSAGDPDALWETFHENTKLGASWTVTPATGTAPEPFQLRPYPEIRLPETTKPWRIRLGSQRRRAGTAAPRLKPAPLTMEQLAAFLRYSGGSGRSSPEDGAALPSLYDAATTRPLEIFFHTAHVAGLPAGLYHYDPLADSVRILYRRDQSHRLAELLIRGDLARTAALLFFVVAVPERSALRWSDRGYRLALLEAGAIVRNVNVAAGALRLACANILDYFDRPIDEYLGFDGVTVSTVAVVAVGREDHGSAVP
jgi:SagB-type dehydrogenase family enzyme